MLLRLPEKYTAERLYAAHVLLDEILGLQYQTETVKGLSNYEIVFDDKKIEIADAFFGKFDGDIKDYLKVENVPDSVFCFSDFDIQLVGIYGSKELNKSDNSAKVGLDIFASAFFMLARWEEYVKPHRDTHSRFPAEAALAVQQKFIKRPIVNEYAEYFYQLFKALGGKQLRKEKQFQFFNTHDIDFLYLFDNNLHRLGKPIKAFLKQGFNAGLGFTKAAFQSIKGQDPYFCFDRLMSESEKYGFQSRFFFMAAKPSELDKGYTLNSSSLRTTFANIIERGHKIGVHPGSLTYNNASHLGEEIEKLEVATGLKLEEGRQHFLKFEAPLTWQLWESRGLKESFTLAYSKVAGFRAGICQAFHPFDFLQRKILKIKEYGTTAMDVSLWGADKENLSPEQASQLLSSLFKTVQYYRGDFVFLWHNSSFGTPDLKEYEFLYAQTLARASKL